MHWSACSADLRSNDRGATAVEFALLFPLFLVLCFGTISGGILFSDKLALTQGAREAARYGATLPYSPGGEATFLGTVLDSAAAADYGQMGSGQVTYCAALRTSTATSHRTRTGTTTTSTVSGSCPGTNTVANPLPGGPHVAVTVGKPASLNLLLYSFEPGIGSTAVARFEGKS